MSYKILFPGLWPQKPILYWQCLHQANTVCYTPEYESSTTPSSHLPSSHLPSSHLPSSHLPSSPLINTPPPPHHPPIDLTPSFPAPLGFLLHLSAISEVGETPGGGLLNYKYDWTQTKRWTKLPRNRWPLGDPWVTPGWPYHDLNLTLENPETYQTREAGTVYSMFFFLVYWSQMCRGECGTRLHLC